MGLNSNESHCGMSLGSHQAALLRTFNNGLEGLSLQPSFKDGLWRQNPYGKPLVHYSGPRMLVDFSKLGRQRGLLWWQKQWHESDDKSNDTNQEQSIEHDKAWQPDGSNMMIWPKHGQLIIYLPSRLKENSLDNNVGQWIADGLQQSKKKFSLDNDEGQWIVDSL